jgi:hypothetical protein
MKLIFAISIMLFCIGYVEAQADAKQPSSGIDLGRNEDVPRDSDLIILSKPKAAYPDGGICVQGTVRLKVEFIKTGKIGKIFPVTRLPHGFTESTIKAAEQMKFRPKRVGGKSVTVFATVEYSFSIY